MRGLDERNRGQSDCCERRHRRDERPRCESTARGASAAQSTPMSGETSTRVTSHSLGVTEAPQSGGVAGTELREDPLVEDTRDEGDQQEVDGDSDLDRKR